VAFGEEHLRHPAGAQPAQEAILAERDALRHGANGIFFPVRVLAGILLVFLARTAFAETTTAALTDVRRLIEVQLRYKEAVDRLEKIILERRLDGAEKIEAHRLLAIASIARGELARAESSFRTVLELDPEFELDPSLSPKIHDVLERVKKELARAPKILELRATPAKERVLFSARVQDPDARLVSIELHTRTNGDRYQEIRMAREGDRLRASVAAPADANLLRVEYFLIGRDAEGEAIARIGDASQPSSVIVKQTAAPKPAGIVPDPAPAAAIEEPPSWYEHWWVWAIAAGVIGASAVAVAVTAGGDEPPGGTLPPIELR
jgi:tetratricopeptide (TPR) repeat protein